MGSKHRSVSFSNHVRWIGAASTLLAAITSQRVQPPGSCPRLQASILSRTALRCEECYTGSRYGTIPAISQESNIARWLAIGLRLDRQRRGRESFSPRSPPPHTLVTSHSRLHSISGQPSIIHPPSIAYPHRRLWLDRSRAQLRRPCHAHHLSSDVCRQSRLRPRRVSELHRRREPTTNHNNSRKQHNHLQWRRASCLRAGIPCLRRKELRRVSDGRVRRCSGPPS